MKIIALIFVLLLQPQAQAAISASTIWEARTTGADTNGGGYVATGTDMSQFDNKNAAGCSSCQSATINISTTDAVANGTTTITSLTGNFSSSAGNNLIGNLIRFSGGTGSITGVWRQVISVTNATTIVLDASIAASTGMTMNIGGALLTPQQASTNSVAGGNVIWVKSGTFSSTTTTTVTVTQLTIHGYHTTRGDADGTRPLMTSATNSIDILTITVAQFSLINMSISSTAGTRGSGLQATTAHTIGHLVSGCVFDGLLNAINGDNIGAHFRFNSITIWNTEIKNSTSKGVIIGSGATAFEISGGSYVHNNGGNGIDLTNTGAVVIRNSIFYLNTGIGANLSGSAATQATVSNVTADANTSDGMVVFVSGGIALVENSLFTNNGGFGLNGSVTGTDYQVRANAFCSAVCTNTSGPRNIIPAGTGDVTLTASPYVSAGTNFGLNSTAGGGAALKGAGFPGAAASGTGSLDIGPLQSQSSSQRAYGSVQ